MVLFRPKAKLYDPVRCIWVSATPEEIVRQRLLYVMIHQLGYPKEFLAIEKQLSELPGCIKRQNSPKRRFDILCYDKCTEELKPLLLIECKEGTPDEKAKRQVIGYNYFIGAPFVAVAGPSIIELIYPEYLDCLPHYSNLCKVKCN